jgi:hypothetical protein
MYIYMHVYIYIKIYIYIRARMHIDTNIHICIYVSTNMYIYIPALQIGGNNEAAIATPTNPFIPPSVTLMPTPIPIYKCVVCVLCVNVYIYT